MALTTKESIYRSTRGSIHTSSKGSESAESEGKIVSLPSLEHERPSAGTENIAKDSLTEFKGEPEKSRVRPLVREPGLKSPFRRFSVLQQYEGIIKEVKNDAFVAELSDLTAGTELDEIMELPIEEISVGDRHLLVEGGVFYWSIGYETKIGGQISRVSEMRMRRMPTWKSGSLEKIKKEANSLLSRFDDGKPDKTQTR